MSAMSALPKKGGARLGAGRKLPKIDQCRAVKLLGEGLTKKEIAARFDVPYKSMLTFFKKLGAQKLRGAYEWTGKYKGAR
jgi:transposase